MTCIEARGLRKAYGSTIALDGVNLRVEEGRILGLIGPNGAGKTTSFNLITGFHRPDSGSVSAFGREITGLKPHDVCALGLARSRARGATRGVLSAVSIGGFLGFTLITPQIIEHFLLVYGALGGDFEANLASRAGLYERYHRLFTALGPSALETQKVSNAGRAIEHLAALAPVCRLNGPTCAIIPFQVVDSFSGGSCCFITSSKFCSAFA